MLEIFVFGVLDNLWKTSPTPLDEQCTTQTPPWVLPLLYPGVYDLRACLVASLVDRQHEPHYFTQNTLYEAF